MRFLSSRGFELFLNLSNQFQLLFTALTRILNHFRMSVVIAFYSIKASKYSTKIGISRSINNNKKMKTTNPMLFNYPSMFEDGLSHHLKIYCGHSKASDWAITNKTVKINISISSFSDWGRRNITANSLVLFLNDIAPLCSL